MTDQNEDAGWADMWRWLGFAVLLLAGLAAYFLYAPRVPPAIRPPVTAESP
ncbi:MAG TPA: hypothetical protein VNH46_03620 [Gemmatimonadales bacterium]|nr:hypothetical protein [Gemmatimonadales bacterium]